MPTIIGAALIALAILWSVRKMSQAVTDALARLSTEVSETIADVAQKLADIAAGTDDTAAAAAINEQADKLNAFQETLITPTPEQAPTVTEELNAAGTPPIEG